MPRIEPTAAPMSVLSVARRIRSSNRMMQIEISKPTPAEIQGLSATGFMIYPVAISMPAKRSRMRTTSACITKAYYHARSVASRKTRQRPVSLKPGEVLFVPVGNAAARPVVGRHLDGDAIADEDAEAVLAHLAGNCGEHDVVAVIEAHFEKGVGLLVDNRALRRD